MTVEHQLKEPYATHVKGVQEQLVKLQAERDKALAAVYLMEQEIAALNRHLRSVMELEIQAADLPLPTEGYQVNGSVLKWETRNGHGEF